jgi:hypothetical protein
MRAYRVYSITQEKHISGPPAILECDDDHQALERAKRLFKGQALEIWDGGRQVARLEPLHK